MKTILNYIIGLFRKNPSNEKIIINRRELRDACDDKISGDVVYIKTTTGIKKIEFL